MADKWRTEKVRRPRADVAKFVDELLWHLALDGRNSGVKFTVGGSWRRGVPMVGDLDVLVVTESGTFEGVVLPSAPFFVGQRAGDKIVQGDFVLDGEKIHVDFWACSKPEVGAMLWFITGPKDLNVAMRRAALAKGWNLSQNGLFVTGLDGKPDYSQQVDDGYEADVAAKLGPEWHALMDPEKREIWLHVLEEQRRQSSQAVTVQVRSSKGDGYYDVKVVGGQGVQCNCRGFVYRSYCRHLEEAAAKLQPLGARPVEERD